MKCNIGLDSFLVKLIFDRICVNIDRTEEIARCRLWVYLNVYTKTAAAGWIKRKDTFLFALLSACPNTSLNGLANRTKKHKTPCLI